MYGMRKHIRHYETMRKQISHIMTAEKIVTSSDPKIKIRKTPEKMLIMWHQQGRCRSFFLHISWCLIGYSTFVCYFFGFT